MRDEVTAGMERPVRGIVVGGSAGAVESLKRLAAALTGPLQAPVLVVVHFPQTAPTLLPGILERVSGLPCLLARHGDELLPGSIYIAPPGQHLRVQDGQVVLDRGPRENRARPAIDPLFRSAAESWGAGALAVLLSGTLDDGAAGMDAVRAAGGVTVVQDPDDALYPDMPRNALALGPADHLLAAEAIGGLLSRLSTRS